MCFNPDSTSTSPLGALKNRKKKKEKERLGSTPHEFNQNLWEWSPGISIFKSSPDDYNVQPVLRITNQIYSHQLIS